MLCFHVLLVFQNVYFDELIYIIAVIVYVLVLLCITLKRICVECFSHKRVINQRYITEPVQ